MLLDAPPHGRAASPLGKGRVRVLECLAPWLCISAARPVGSVGSGAARQQQQQEGQQQQPGDGAGWLRDTRTAPSDRTRPHSAPVPITTTMVKTFQAYLPSCHRTYSCIHCRAHLANHDELISKSFQGSQGRAYLFNSVNMHLNRVRSTRRASTSSNWRI
ncbi:uncharacterized protein LOC122261372 isoform X3 [Penaeus japonicus]|uniref:uncharacterized protein LOC122261372 isoform X3 n=1 Tax=Penaeus japonicus TaxID=27405 RepID=UPI001C70C9BE|nr:uncharacterized protein LOC122261372 isoform X3 [Penaeus japonicus]